MDVPNATVMVIENAERYGLISPAPAAGPGGPRGGTRAAASWSATTTGEAVQKRLQVPLLHHRRLSPWPSTIWSTGAPAISSAAASTACPPCRSPTLTERHPHPRDAAQSEAVALLAEDPLLEHPDHALLAAQVQQMFEKAGAMN